MPLPSIESDAFADPVWNALHSTHRDLALTVGLACKYPQDVAPFAAIAPYLSADATPSALRDLRSLLAPDESTYVAGPEPPPTPGLHREPGPLCLQMAFPPDSPLPPVTASSITRLTCADAPAMVALTDLAFPGFFRANTCRMGSYYGIWHNPPGQPRQLIAMAGERLCPYPFRELSGVCTHPEFRGQGHAAQLITGLLADHRQAGALSALHVAAANRSAIDLYLRLGFHPLRHLQLHRLTRTL